ncbi:MAG: PKD domain-containing protein [Opitutaceae bacterium]
MKTQKIDLVEGALNSRVCRRGPRVLGGVIAGLAAAACGLGAPGSGLNVAIDARGQYVIGAAGNPVLVSGVAAKVDGNWVRSEDYPSHKVEKTSAEGYLGVADQWEVVSSGLPGKPDLAYRLRAYRSEPFADLQVEVRNHTGRAVEVEDIRAVEASGAGVAALGGPAWADRVLSDSYSEDPDVFRGSPSDIQISDLGDAPHRMHRAVGSQLIYNRKSGRSLFIGALTSKRFLTILRLHVGGAGNASHPTRYEVDSTGTTEMVKGNALHDAPAIDQVELSLPVPAGGHLSSEILAIGAGADYHHQLETYGALIRRINHARVSAPPLMGWWSYTAFYHGLNAGAALTNAAWEAEHLKPFGYDVFFIDDGYQFARGEYMTSDAALYPHGLGPVEYQVRGYGLVPGVWTAPFEVSDRSWVYQRHRDWLVKNARGEPIPIGYVTDGKGRLYVLDTTNPGAQEYLRATYRKLVREWGIHFIKLDFMDDSAIEGYYHRPHTTAMEAQRIGLGIIRDAVGNGVYLDKDGSVMLNPVGYVDYGRLSDDTGHMFRDSRAVATGIAARYYMDRNFYVSDPDAFTVSRWPTGGRLYGEHGRLLTLDKARVSIALAAVSGGIFSIGNDLPQLENEPHRLALIENRDLIDMVRLGRASVPIDLMSYAAADRQPSLFYLKESDRQSVLTVFNWTNGPRAKTIPLASLGLTAAGPYTVTDVFDGKEVDSAAGALALEQPADSVRVLKIVDTAVPVAPPKITADCPTAGTAGECAAFSAHSDEARPALSFRWDFGDGVWADGSQVTHTWTEPGNYKVRLTAAGLDHSHSERSWTVRVTGHMPVDFDLSRNRRFVE